MSGMRFFSYRIFFICLFAAMLPAFLLIDSLSAQKGASAQENAADFSLPDLHGNTVSLSDFRGRLVVVDFWATWCVPCRKSLPEMAALEKKYRDRGLVVLGLDIDDPGSFDNQYVSKFIKKFDVEYTILRADKSVVAQYLGTDNPSVPTLFIIDGQGRILEKHEGFTAGELEPLVQHWLK